MKKIIATLFSLLLLLAVTEAKAQTTLDTSKDEFWGTPKANRGTSTDAVGARSEDLDSRYNAYETGKRGSFRLTKYNNKKLNEMQKKEEKLLKKHKRQKRQRERRMNR